MKLHVDAVFASYRRSRHVQQTQQSVLKIEGVRGKRQAQVRDELRKCRESAAPETTGRRRGP